MRSRPNVLWSVLSAVLSRPGLWGTAIRQAQKFAPDGWWRSPPFLPLPDPELLAFRSVTQYGDPDHDPESGDIVTWLQWCRAEHRRRRM